MNKAIGLWSAVSIGVGGMVGAGIFSILGTACQITGNAVYISFIIAGLVAMLSIYSYAKLGSRFPSAGGPVEFLIRGFGDTTFTGGLNIVLWVGYIFALALYARAFGAYAVTFFPNIPVYWVNIFATVVILLFTAVNFIGARAVGRSELAIVVVKVGILLLFSLIGIFFAQPSRLSLSLWPPLNDIFFAAGVLFLAYEGFGLITNAAEDMDNPRKTLPRALYLSISIVILIYVFVSIAVITNLPLSEIIKSKDYALAAAAKPFLGLLGFKIIALAALFSTSSAINATLYGGANVSYIIAKDGQLPKIFERKVWKKSVEGLFITSALVIVFANFFDLGNIAMLGSASFLIIYAAVNIGHLRLHKQTGANSHIIWLAIMGCLSSLVILTYYLLISSPITLIVLIFVLLTSFITEWIYRRHTKRALKQRKGKASLAFHFI